MSIQTVFRAGNSQVIAIPADILSDLKIKSGDKVLIEKISGEALVVKKTGSKTASGKFSQTEFKRWLNSVLKEDAEILDELANR